jgi:hypothetical protein
MSWPVIRSRSKHVMSIGPPRLTWDRSAVVLTAGAGRGRDDVGVTTGAEVDLTVDGAGPGSGPAAEPTSCNPTKTDTAAIAAPTPIRIHPLFTTVDRLPDPDDHRQWQ